MIRLPTKQYFLLDGYYCRSFAVEHTHCSPGQSTKSPGTKTTDTMCEECQHGFYSQHGVNCTAWTGACH
uniref:TNFR-Cys domain-containing protein n=1 Tax=Hucho hucho TaxID=62062 RepID=A0A4W5JF32_9TELE